MKLFFIACIIAGFLSCTNALEDKIQSVRLTYIPWSCDCANWIEPDTAAKYEGAGGDILAGHCIFIEAAEGITPLPDTLGYANDIIEFTGRFYIKKGLPAGYKSQEPIDKARVFRYTAYKVIISNYGKGAKSLPHK